MIFMDDDDRFVLEAEGRFVSFSEDDRKHAETEIQKLTDKHIKEIDLLVQQKEKEIMEV